MKHVESWHRCVGENAGHFRSGLCRVGLLVLCYAVSAYDSAIGNPSTDQNAPSTSSDHAGAHKALSKGKTIGFVLSDFDYFYDAKDDQADCPNGFRHTNRDNWEAQFPTKVARQRHLDRCGDIRNRGPNCENVWFAPEVIQDPLPYREVRGNAAYGINLDGTQDGRGTENTCAHEKFISPSRAPGVDNQYYRFLGCEKILRHVPEGTARLSIQQVLVQRLLLEIIGVDDERNDASVEVAMYRGRDPLIVDAAGKVVPWQSQRIDEGPRELIFRGRGQIVHSELITEPTDVVWDDRAWERRLLIRGMALHLTLTPTGAEGLRVGYVDLNQLWQSYSRYMAGFGALVGASAPSDYSALHRLADGYKDPQTGACTALSSARKLEFVRAHVIHPSKEMNP